MRTPAAVIGLAAAILTSPIQAQTVMLTPTPDGVTAEYRLDERADRFVFADAGALRTDWRSLSPGVTLDAEGVRSESAVDRFSLELAPDSTEEGRGYIALTRLGEGYVVHSPALRGRDETLTLEFDLPQGWIARPGGPFDGYLYLGPASNVKERPNGGLHIEAEGAATPVVTTLFETFDVALNVFTERFGPLPRPPILSVTRQGAGPMPFRGDVTDSGMISIRLNGDLAETTDPDVLELTRHFVFHETSHLWNSHLSRPADGSPWLHEGGAEYLALVGAVSTGLIDEGQARAGLSQRLNDCRANLGTRPDAEARINANSAAYYSCGAVLQWLADMELRREGGGGIVAMWAALIDRARQGRPDYGPADFRAAVGPTSAALILLDGAPDTRWTDIDAALTGLGVRWRNRPSSQTLMVSALQHLNRQACPAGASRGFSMRDGYVELGNDTACGPLAGEIALASVEGHDVLTATSAMFEAVQARCARREPVSLLRRGSDVAIAVPCAADLPTPAAYDLTDTPPIAMLPTAN